MMPFFLTDMGAAEPKRALSTTPGKDRWLVLEYEAEGLKGRMVSAAPTVQPPDLVLPLNARGWHAVSIGLWLALSYTDVRVKHRLASEAVFRVTHLRPDFKWDRTEIVETFPFYADLSGEDLVLAKDTSCQPPAAAHVAYVRLEPLSAERVAEIRRDRECTETRRLVSINDGEGLFRSDSPRTRGELLEQVELYRHSDVGKVLWGVNLGDLTYYRSSVGKFCFAENEGVYPTLGVQFAAESHKALSASGVSVPFKEVMEHAHAMGIEFHTYYRLALADHSHPHNIFSTESFFVREHPECRIVAKDGTPMLKASYAFPEVRGFMVSLLEEAMQYDIDGVNLCFDRGPEYFGYEAPVVDDFRRLYGCDPRELRDDDERLLRLRAGYLTEFVRAVRQAADKHGERRGRRIQVSASAPWSNERMLYFGYDCYTWINERLLDFILAIGPSDLLQSAREQGIKVYGFGSSAWESTPTEVHVQDMKHAYAAGLDGLSLWDLNSVQSLPEKWVVLGRLGHKDKVLDYSPHPRHLPKMKRCKVLSIAGKDFAHTEYRNAPEGVPPEMLSVYTGG
jgi:hypothetical protein